MYFLAIASMCCVGALVRALGHAPADGDVLVGVLHVLHRQRHARVALEVARPGTTLGGVEHGHAVLDVHPHRRHLHGAVRTECGDLAEVLGLQQFLAATLDS